MKGGVRPHLSFHAIFSKASLMGTGEPESGGGEQEGEYGMENGSIRKQANRSIGESEYRRTMHLSGYWMEEVG